MSSALTVEQKSKVTVYLHNLIEILKEAELAGIDPSMLINAAFSRVALDTRGCMYAIPTETTNV